MGEREAGSSPYELLLCIYIGISLVGTTEHA